MKRWRLSNSRATNNKQALSRKCVCEQAGSETVMANRSCVRSVEFVWEVSIGLVTI